MLLADQRIFTNTPQCILPLCTHQHHPSTTHHYIAYCMGSPHSAYGVGFHMIAMANEAIAGRLITHAPQAQLAHVPRANK